MQARGALSPRRTPPRKGPRTPAWWAAVTQSIAECNRGQTHEPYVSDPDFLSQELGDPAPPTGWLRPCRWATSGSERRRGPKGAFLVSLE